MRKLKVLWVGDGVTPTGFSTVNHGIIDNLSKKEFDVHHLAINYNGDPHEYDWKIYPAMYGGDYLGMNRLRMFADTEFDGIFILNDVWVIAKYLEVIKQTFRKIPPIVVYFPVDSKELSSEWFKDFDIVTKTVVYTQFGYDEVVKVSEEIGPIIIPHGVNQEIFRKLPKSKEELRSVMLPNKPEFRDAFIILNASRNQPRKRFDITLEGFKLFAEDKPENVKLYCHTGVKDVGWDLGKLSVRYGIDKKLIFTSMTRGIQAIEPTKLNMIYNICDVGLNTSIGEGWSLSNMEHAAVGAPQIVPDHSACREVFSDCAITIPINQWLVSMEQLTVGGLVSPEDVAKSLNLIYEDKKLYKELSRRAYEKFSDEKFSWKYITTNSWTPVLEDVFTR